MGALSLVFIAVPSPRVVAVPDEGATSKRKRAAARGSRTVAFSSIEALP